MQLFRILFLITLGFALAGCDNQITFDEQLELDKSLIADYVAANNLVGEYTSGGVFYGFTKEGNTTYPTTANTVEVIYTGKLLDGTVFDSSQGFPISFSLFQVIAGWQQGMVNFSEGSIGYLLIPSSLAYGRNGSGIIPPNSVLYFDIELLDVR
ncbi:MAG: FKBP-type peptidyl-prolyl cis-trans isomerase [Bacteroidia bacterium]|nr:FKBP-type peptidyl-prolyl cis-trans isomerase [Bacteroidia bacterium]